MVEKLACIVIYYIDRQTLGMWFVQYIDKSVNQNEIEKLNKTLSSSQ